MIAVEVVRNCWNQDVLKVELTELAGRLDEDYDSQKVVNGWFLP